MEGMPAPALLRAPDSSLIVIDIQERLAAVMPEREAVLRNTAVLLEAASRLAVPVLLTEQYPKGLVATVPDLAAKLPPGPKQDVTTCSDP